MKKLVYAYLHTHWDREWYRNKEDFNLRLLDVFDIVLDELTHNKAPFFYLDGQVIALLDYLKYRQEKEEIIKKLIKENKLAIGPYFVSADSYLVNFMSMLKNIDLGIQISKQFGQKNNYIGYLSDIFGISNSIFEALKLKNINKAIIWRGVNPKKIKNHCDFIKNDIKTTWLVQGYFNDFFHNEPINIENIEKHIEKIAKYSSDNLLMPIGADHLGMLKNAQEKIDIINSKLKDYKIILTSPQEYFKHVQFENTIKENEFLDNSDTYILSGVYSARIPQKIKNNQIQNDLSRKIEPLNYYLKDKFETNINEIYKTLIKNHAHDGIYGCSIDSVHRKINSRQDKCQDMINGISKRLIGNFKTKNNITGQSKNRIGIFNLTNSKDLKIIKLELPYKIKNSQIIEEKRGFNDDLLYDIYKIPITEDISPIYTQLVEITKNNNFEFTTVDVKKPTKQVKITKNSIENNFIKLEIKNKKINILNKKTNEVFNLKLTDIKDDGDSYNFSPKGKYKVFSIEKSEIKYSGEIQSCLRLYFKNITLDVFLDNYSEYLKFNSTINNKTKDHKIQLSVETKENIKKTISQDAIGVTERKIDYNYDIKSYMPAKRPYELKTNTYPMQNFVCANNIILLTKGLNEYEVSKNELKICLLRCFSTISNPKNKTRAIPAGPDLKTPEAELLGENKSEFILSFGTYKKAFKILDNLFENYYIIDGTFREKINLKLDSIPDNTYFYGINQNKKILYNYKENKILTI